MTAVWLMARSELRGRVGSVIGLAVIVGVVGAVVMAGAAGARRTNSAVDRWADENRLSQLTVFSAYNELMADPPRRDRVLDQMGAAVSAVDGVEEVAPVVGFVASAPGLADGLSLGVPLDADAYDIDRPGRLTGRLPRPDSMDEVFLGEMAADRTGLGIGDRLQVQTITTATFGPVLRGELSGPEMAALAPDGPRFDLEVVGIGRLPSELDGDPFITPSAFVSPAFHERYHDELAVEAVAVQVVTDGSVTEATVRAAVEDAGIPAEIGIDRAADRLDELQGNNGVIAAGIAVFAAVAALVGAFVIVQAVAREVSLSAPSDAVGASLGMTRRQRTMAMATPAFAGVVVGMAVAVALAIAVSPVFPISQAERTEPTPGVVVDLVVLAGGLALMVVIGALACAWGARRARTAPAVSVARRALVPLAAGEQGLPAALGGRLALLRRRRSAVALTMLAVAGVVGTGVVLASITVMFDDLERSGISWSSQPDLFGSDPETTAVALAAEDGIAAAAERRCLEVELGGRIVGACATRSLRGAVPPVVTTGRAPAGPGEVAVSASARRDLDVEIGETVEGTSTDGGPIPLKVVGEAIVPFAGDYEGLFGGGDVIVDFADLERLQRPGTGTDTGRVLLLTYDDGVDPGALEQRLVAAHPDQVGFPESTRPAPPLRIYLLDLLSPWLVGLGAFLGALGLLGLAQHLMVTTRRGRRDFAVLRCLGFRRPQVRGTLSWQAVVATLVGLAVGVPLGVVVGRAAWRLAVSGLDIIDAPATPWLLILLLPPVAVAAAAGLALVPGRRASRRRPADALRAE